MDRVLKFFVIFLVLFNIFYISLPQNVSNAGTEWDSLIKKATPTADDVPTGNTLLIGVIKKLLSFLQVASGLIAILVIAFTGFNYVVASDPNIKEEMKKKMLPLIIGLICVFSASSIASFILGVVGG